MSLRDFIRIWRRRRKSPKSALRPPASSPPWQASIAQDLDRLASRAWRQRGSPDDHRFFLKPGSLPAPKTIGDLERCLELLYCHAREWAGGFEVPFRRPKVRLSYLTDLPGSYAVDPDGDITINVSPSLVRNPVSARAVLAQEACHHILDISGLNTHDPEIDEPLTDLAMFICGFGQVFLDGRSYRGNIDQKWCTVHLGYLTDQQYQFAHEWTLRVIEKKQPENREPERAGYDHRYQRTKLLNKLAATYPLWSASWIDSDCG